MISFADWLKLPLSLSLSVAGIASKSCRKPGWQARFTSVSQAQPGYGLTISLNSRKKEDAAVQPILQELRSNIFEHAHSQFRLLGICAYFI